MDSADLRCAAKRNGRLINDGDEEVIENISVVFVNVLCLRIRRVATGD